MALVSVTRLRIRSLFYLPQFVWDNNLSLRQLANSPGFLAGRLLVDRHLTFWTMTAWESEEAMRVYRNGGAHRRVMPRLIKWCDEASVVHWNQETSTLPDWQDAHRLMISQGKVSKVKNPSPNQATKQFPVPKVGRLSREMGPAQKHSAKATPFPERSATN